MLQTETEIIVFIILATVIFILFLAGVFLFFLQFKRKKIEYDKGRELLNQLHQQELLKSQLDTQQQTMQHIGREIHDNVGQKLTLASLYSKQLHGLEKGKVQDRLEEIGNIIDESLTELRQLSKSLTNPDLSNASLAQLLKAEAKKINATGICYVSVNEKEPDTVLQQADKNIIFRLLQEFMQNSLKHAACRKININIEKQNEILYVAATDDGKGFDISAASTGIGLQNMKRRAEQLNAVYLLESTPGKGTALKLQLKLS